MADGGRSPRWVCKWRSRGGRRRRSSLDVFSVHIPQPPRPEEVRAVRNAPHQHRYWRATSTAASCLPLPKHVHASTPSSNKPIGVPRAFRFCSYLTHYSLIDLPDKVLYILKICWYYLSVTCHPLTQLHLQPPCWTDVCLDVSAKLAEVRPWFI